MKKIQACHIQEQNIGTKVQNCFERLGRIPGFAHHFYVGLVLQQATNTLPDQGMVIGHYAADLGARVGFRNRRFVRIHFASWGQ